MPPPHMPHTHIHTPLSILYTTFLLHLIIFVSSGNSTTDNYGKLSETTLYIAEHFSRDETIAVPENLSHIIYLETYFGHRIL